MKEKKQTNSNFLDRRGFIDDGFFYNSLFEGDKPLWSVEWDYEKRRYWKKMRKLVLWFIKMIK